MKKLLTTIKLDTMNAEQLIELADRFNNQLKEINILTGKIKSTDPYILEQIKTYHYSEEMFYNDSIKMYDPFELETDQQFLNKKDLDVEIMFYDNYTFEIRFKEHWLNKKDGE